MKASEKEIRIYQVLIKWEVKEKGQKLRHWLLILKRNTKKKWKTTQWFIFSKDIYRKNVWKSMDGYTVGDRKMGRVHSVHAD